MAGNSDPSKVSWTKQSFSLSHLQPAWSWSSFEQNRT